ncbi:MAG: FlgD immunoglobulin-like domain containing protein [Candidatus Eisenbacteria bacterium]
MPASTSAPTTDFSVCAADHRQLINFEDLILAAINYGSVVSLNGEGSEVAAVPESPRLRLSFDPARVDGARVARLWLDGNLEAVKGVHAGLRFDPRQAELLSVNPGDLVAAQSTETFFRAPTADGMLWVDLAALGNGRTLHGSGDLAIVTYRTRLATGPFTLATSDLRDRENRFLLDRPAGAPRHDVSNRHDLADPSPSVSDREELRWLGARPNPFPRSTELRFALGSAGPVEITIYNPAGRRVRGLLHEAMEAGEHVITWDGNDDQGRATGAAVYLVRVQAGDATTTAKLYRYR